MRYLIDTNIFLEILLHQGKEDVCRNFIDNNLGNVGISDFSLHSIGVILFKFKHYKTFTDFVTDIFLGIQLLSLQEAAYKELATVRKKFNLDFDDAYQYTVAQHYGIQIVTMDKDFRKVSEVEVMFLRAFSPLECMKCKKEKLPPLLCITFVDISSLFSYPF